MFKNQLEGKMMENKTANNSFKSSDHRRVVFFPRLKTTVL